MCARSDEDNGVGFARPSFEHWGLKYDGEIGNTACGGEESQHDSQV